MRELLSLPARQSAFSSDCPSVRIDVYKRQATQPVSTLLNFVPHYNGSQLRQSRTDSSAYSIPGYRNMRIRRCGKSQLKSSKAFCLGALRFVISGEAGDHADGPAQDIADEANLALDEQTSVFIGDFVLDLLGYVLGIDLKKLACNACLLYTSAARQRT